jgi:hypothetical protein
MSPRKEFLTRCNDVDIKFDVINMLDGRMFEDFVHDISIAPTNHQDTNRICMLKESDVSHHFVVRVRVTFRELHDAVEPQDLAEMMRLVDFNGLILGAHGKEGGTQDSDRLRKARFNITFF